MKAILLCAGQGTRFQPISFALPKHLLPVKGIPLAERTIQMLKQNGVTDITLVTGYLAERFAYLAAKYNVSLLYNKQFKNTSNNSSLALASEFLDGALVLDGDVLFTQDIFRHIAECRNKLGKGASFFVSQETTRGLEWEFVMDDAAAPATGNGFHRETGSPANAPWEIRRALAVRKWSPKGFAMSGCSWWAGDGASRLREELLRNPDDYSWEDAAVRVMETVPLYALCMRRPFALELDSIKDALDAHLLSPQEAAALCSTDYRPVKLKGLTNSTWKIRSQDGSFKVLRIPGHGTEHYISRDDEPKVVNLLAGMGITPATTFFQDGLKLSDFLPEHRTSRSEDMTARYFAGLAHCLAQMHAVCSSACPELEPTYIGRQMELYENRTGNRAAPPYHSWLRSKAAEFDNGETVLCHRDLLLENIMVLDNHGTDMQLIDFEYAGFAHPLWDYASFILESGISGDVRDTFLAECGIRDEAARQRVWHMEILQDYIWGMWGQVNQYQDYAAERLKRAFDRLGELLGRDDFSLPMEPV